MTMRVQILITPISKKYKTNGPCPKKDWEEQLLRCQNFEQMMWDDSPTNNSKVNDIMIFWQHKKGVTFHRITEIKDPSFRSQMTFWSDNKSHQNRQVLFLSREIYSLEWEKWKQLGGQERCMGTKPILKEKDSIVKHLLDNRIIENLYS